MSAVAKQVADLIGSTLAGMGYELVGIEYGDHGHGGLLRVYIDRVGGITLDDCAAVSGQVSAILDVEDPIAGHYDLEVSSPGMDRPLFTEAHYARFIGHRIKIVMSLPQDGRRRFSGVLRTIKDGVIEIDVDNELFYLPFSQVASARLIPEF
jgi:ribosome maturation factor RimP